jgi:hypothetical protein
VYDLFDCFILANMSLEVQKYFCRMSMTILKNNTITRQKGAE